jgi:putative hydrolase of the HAD superfamily
MNRLYDAVLFDLGNTLVSYYKTADFDPILRASIAAIGTVLGQHGRPIDIEATYAVAKTLNRENVDGRVWPLGERLSTLAGEPTGVLAEPLMNELVDAFLGPIFSTAMVDPDAAALLLRLRADGLKTAIVSNTPWGSPSSRWRVELNRLGLLDCVDEVVFCVDVGWRKPAPQPFERAMSLLRTSPERTAFVGDDVRWDVLGAKSVGIEPILITNASPGEAGLKTIRKLTELLPLISPAQ